jgi:hypothetical protein
VLLGSMASAAAASAMAAWRRRGIRLRPGLAGYGMS